MVVVKVNFGDGGEGLFVYGDDGIRGRLVSPNGGEIMWG